MNHERRRTVHFDHVYLRSGGGEARGSQQKARYGVAATQWASDRPARLATAIGPQRNGPLHPHLAEEYREWSGGRDWKQDFPEWEPVHRILFKSGILGIENVGGDIDKVTGRRCTFALFPWNWERGDGCIIRLVAILDPKGAYRIEKGEKF